MGRRPQPAFEPCVRTPGKARDLPDQLQILVKERPRCQATQAKACWSTGTRERDMALLERYKVWICDRKETLRSPTPFDLWMLQYNYDNIGLQYGHEYFCRARVPGLRLQAEGRLGLRRHPLHHRRGARRAPGEVRGADRARGSRTSGASTTRASTKSWRCTRRPRPSTSSAARTSSCRTPSIEWLWLYRRAGNLHMVWLLAYCKIYEMFEEMCKELVGHRPERPPVQRPHGRLQPQDPADRPGDVLSRSKGPGDGARAALRAARRTMRSCWPSWKDSDAGRAWLAAFREFLDEYGWRTIENWDASHPTWIEKPSQVLPLDQALHDGAGVRPRRSASQADRGAGRGRRRRSSPGCRRTSGRSSPS